MRARVPDRHGRRQFSLISLFGVLTVVAILLALPLGSVLLWTLVGPLLTALILVATCILLQLPIFYLLVGRRPSASKPGRR